jgi:hypothetical protein
MSAVVAFSRRLLVEGSQLGSHAGYRAAYPHICGKGGVGALEAASPEELAFDLLERLLPNANHETKAWVKTPISIRFTTIHAGRG